MIDELVFLFGFTKVRSSLRVEWVEVGWRKGATFIYVTLA